MLSLIRRHGRQTVEALLLFAVCSALYLWLRDRWALSGAWTFEYAGGVYHLLRPELLSWLAFIPLLFLGIRWSLADLPWQQRAFSLALRVGFLALLVAGLAQLVKLTTSDRTQTVVLLDVSDSVTDEALSVGIEQFNAVRSNVRPTDELRLIAFAQRPKLVPLRDANGEALSLTPEALRPAQPSHGAGTNIQAALQLAYATYVPGFIKRALLLSDGTETEGDAALEASLAASFGVRLFTTSYGKPPPKEVAVVELRAPNRVEIGRPFQLHATIYSSVENRAKLYLYQGEVLNGLGGIQEVQLQPGTNSVSFDSVVRFGGEITYRIELSPGGPDQFKANNKVSTRIQVHGRPTVLLVDSQPERASYLASALGAQQFEVDVRAPSAFPASLQEIGRYDMVILSDVPRNQLTAAGVSLIERYVRDLGGGFLFAGGEAGYALGGWSNTQMERLLPVRMDTENSKETPSVAMVLVIDRSGSMSGLPMEMAKAACRATVGTLQGDDRVEIIAFESEPRRYVKMQPARYRSRIQNDIARITSSGGTSIFPALDMAYQDISIVQARKKHVILLTDGRAARDGIRDLVQAMLSESITVTTVGLGAEADTDLLRMIAETGAGRFHAVPDPSRLPRIFTRETEFIAKQAAVQEWFPVTLTSNADFLRGINMRLAPLLHGYVSTQLKPSPAKTILASDRGEPILARWRVGLGHVLAWTSDLKNNWAVDWLRWGGFSRFWGQLVQEHMRKDDRRELPMKIQLFGDRVHVTTDAFTASERFDNTLQSSVVLNGPGVSEDAEPIPLKLSAPGRYEAGFQLPGYGTYTLKASHMKETRVGALRQHAVSRGTVNNPYPVEYANLEPNLELLSQLAKSGGGKLDANAKTVIAPEGEEIEQNTPLWPWLIYASIACFLGDLLLRRVRLFDRTFVRT